MSPATAPVIPIDPADPDPVAVERAAALLRGGRLVAIPTETVYGLGANALDPDAVARVFEAKGRPATDPLIVHVDGLAMAATVVDGPLPPIAETLAEAFWPGPLTLVLPRADAVPTAVTSGLDSVGVRCPSHPVAAAIITAAGVPIAAPSANRFGRISPTRAAHVVEELGDRIDAIVDGGPTDRGVESTVVAVEDDTAVVLRHGAVTLEDLQRHVAARDVHDTDTATTAASPGHDERHYSPGCPTIATVDGLDLAGIPATGEVLYLGYTDGRPELPRGWRFEALGRRADLDGVARELYGRLRDADARQPHAIVVELTGADGIGRAIDDRLTRAASSVVARSAAEVAAALASS